MISMPEGVWAVRSVKRVPKEMRWGDDCVNWVPWRRYKDAEDMDGEVPEGVLAEEVIDRKAPRSAKMEVQVRSEVPRKFYITQRDAEQYGLTRGCGGVLAGRPGGSGARWGDPLGHWRQSAGEASCTPWRPQGDAQGRPIGRPARVGGGRA